LFALDLVTQTAVAAEPQRAMDSSAQETAASTAYSSSPLQTEPETPSRAIHCLTEAVYYEAASEPREGQEAVAQVVLNRLRHRGFPKSVCGVVFEGAARTSGCQFTFTCDGSLARRPAAWRWGEAEQVATAALSGHVAGDVGTATHYHTVSVKPYWSAALVPVRRIGNHIFYRMPDRPGSPEALADQYDREERQPATTTQLSIGRASLRGPEKGQTAFSVWGLKLDTVSTIRGRIVVRPEPDRTVEIVSSGS
jgi:spore germination cell wall hydrolase CwlJ-like protein